VSEPSAYRVTAYYVCHDWRLSGVVEASAPGPLSRAEAERLAFAAAEAAVARAGTTAAGARIDVGGVTFHPPEPPAKKAGKAKGKKG
jgi:hypothetical protein